MYIPEFWCGVIATIAFEVLSSIVLILYFAKKEKEKR